MEKQKLISYFFWVSGVKDVRRYHDVHNLSSKTSDHDFMSTFMRVGSHRGLGHCFETQKGLRETVADHTHNALLIGRAIMDAYPELGLNREKVMDILCDHDLPEVGMDFDYSGVKSAEDPNYKVLKNAAEQKTIDKLTRIYGNNFVSNLKEYDAGQTREALFAKFVDKLESKVFLIKRGVEYCDKTELDFGATSPNKYVKYFPELAPLWQELQCVMRDEYERAGYPWKKEYSIENNFVV